MNQAEEHLATNDQDVSSFIEAGLHLGHSHSKSHPQMKPFIFGTRNNIDIIDVVKTKENLEAAKVFLEGVARKGGMILFVGTRPGTRKLLEQIAQDLGMPFVTTRWIGGTLTNFSIISKRLKEMEELERLRVSREIEKYPKKERILKERELMRLQKLFGGLRLMRQLPQAVVILNVVQDSLATREARKVGVPSVGIVDTNANPKAVDYPIPANDDAITSVQFILEKLAEAIRNGEAARKGEGVSTQVSPAHV